MIEECALLPLAEERLASVENAKLMARHLDDNDLTGIWPQCHRALALAMADLRPTKPKRKTVRANIVRIIR